MRLGLILVNLLLWIAYCNGYAYDNPLIVNVDYD